MTIPLVYALHSGNLYGTERMALATLQGLRDRFDCFAVPFGSHIGVGGKTAVAPLRTSPWPPHRHSLSLPPAMPPLQTRQADR